MTGLTEALVRRGITDAGLQLLAGAFSEMQYLTGQPDDSGQRLATYGAPTTLPGPVRLVGGNGILGRDAAGKPLLHCHAVVVDREGRVHGGHLPPNVCKLGPAGVTALVTVIDGAGFQVSHDAETNYDILPADRGAGRVSDAMTGADFEAEFEDGRFGRLAVVRLKPDQDLVEGIEAAAMEAGIAYGVVRAAVGSLVDAALGYGEGGRMPRLSRSRDRASRFSHWPANCARTRTARRARCCRARSPTPTPRSTAAPSYGAPTQSASRWSWCCRNGFRKQARPRSNVILPRTFPVHRRPECSRR